MKKKTSPPFNQPFILIIILAVLVVLGIYTYQNFVGKQEEKAGGLSKVEMLSRGIHPDPVNIKVLEDITAQWQDKSIAYVLEKVYFTPDIADLGPSRNNVSMKDKSFLIVQLNVRDRRTSGSRRLIPAGNYLRIRQNREDSAPIINDYLYLSPQENGTVYVTFPVERNMSQFTLLVGILSNPRVVSLNFDSNAAILLNGVFLLKQGFSPEYKE